MLNTDHDLIISTADLERLQAVLDQYDTPAAELLDLELRRARRVPPAEIPADVVTMNSEVVYEDCATGARRTVRLVYPQDADAATGRISVLAPIGSALIGLRAGQEITWKVPQGEKRIRVVEVHAPSEATADANR